LAVASYPSCPFGVSPVGRGELSQLAVASYKNKNKNKNILFLLEKRFQQGC
jgi:hypothetical protein